MCYVLHRILRKQSWTKQTPLQSSWSSLLVKRRTGKQSHSNNSIIILRLGKGNFNAFWALITETILKTTGSKSFFKEVTYKLKLEE